MDVKNLAARDRERCFHLAKAYFNTFYNRKTKELLFNFPNDRGLASCWEYIGLMSMTDKLAQIDPATLPLLREVIDGLEYYGFQKDGGLWGYVVNRGKSPLGATDPGLAFDDNIWLTINFLRAYDLTKESGYLEKAKFLVEFLIREAWFEPLGGMFWDSRKDARHSCSNNPLIKPLVDIYRITGTVRYLDWAKKVYSFSLKLKDPTLHVFHDLVRASKDEAGNWAEGVPGGGFYSYNTGSFISGASALYEVTGDQQYLREALDAADGAFRYFASKGPEGCVEFPVSTTVWFNSILLKGFLDVYPFAKPQCLPYIQAFQQSIDYAYEHFLKDGFLPSAWLRGWQDVKKDTNKEALDHSANVEIYALLSLFENSRHDSDQ